MSLCRGTGPVGIGGRVVYGVFVALDGGLRLRVAVDDWERVGVRDGERVEVTLPGEPKRWYFVAGVWWVETWYWVELLTAPANTTLPRLSLAADRPHGPDT